MRMIIGIDQSFSSTGIVAIDEKGGIRQRRTIGKHDVSHESVREILWNINNFVEAVKATYTECNIVVACEQPPYSKGGSSSYQMLCALYGAIMCNIADVSVNISSWKSKVMFNKLRMSDKRSKQGRVNYIKKIKDKFGKHFDNTDTADAYCIAQYVLQGFTQDENT